MKDVMEKAAKALGQETESFALHSKGLEVSQSNPTPTVSLALSWATSNRGACHLEGFSHQIEGGVPFPEMGYFKAMDGTSGEGKGKMTALAQNYMAVFNALGLCKFLFFAHVSHETLCQWIDSLQSPWPYGSIEATSDSALKMSPGPLTVFAFDVSPSRRDLSRRKQEA